MNGPPHDDTDSDYGSELDFTDEALLDVLDRAQSSFIKQQSESAQNRPTQTGGSLNEIHVELETLGPLVGEASAKLSERRVEDQRSLWERYRKSRNWGALSVSDLSSPSWCEQQHAYRLASKSWLPPLKRPATITSSKGVELVVDTKKTVKREKVLVKGTEIHAKIEKTVMGDVQQVRVETEGNREAWWALRILNTIVSLTILIEKGRVREIPVVGFVGDFLVFGVIDEIERREIPISPLASSLPRSRAPQQKTSPAKSARKAQPSTPKKSSPSTSKLTPSPSKKNDQSTLLQFFSPSPTTSQPKPALDLAGNGVNGARDKGKGKETNFDSDDLFMGLTQTDDEADLAALAEVEALEKLRLELEAVEGTKTRWGYIISDTKSRFNRSLPPEAETIPAKLQLMLYHRLFTSLLQPEPPPTTAPSSSSPNPAPSLVPTGPFLWSKLYSKFDLSSDAPLPTSFLATIKPVIEGSELEDLLSNASTLREFVRALAKVGEMLKGGRAESKVLEDEMELSYVLRQEEGAGRWKGRRSAKKKKKKESITVDARSNSKLEMDDEEADLEAAIRLSLQDQDQQVAANDVDVENKRVPEEEEDIAGGDSQLPFLANPSLPLPFELPPPLSVEESLSDDDHHALKGAIPLSSLPTNSQAALQDEPSPAIPLSRRHGTRSSSSAPPPALPQAPRKRPRSPSLPQTPPQLIGVSRFPLSLPLLSSHLAESLSYWNGERDPIGVSIEEVRRCRTCEFEEGCEWRAGKAKEMEEKGRERKLAREREKKELVSK
ncbi:uncharacterized protein JCM6883_004250 [Sporobolomyces salmoneus]|uniref:uncharacterized protein n=1 Tax=Sporobolomyces salmoneus TaxID=183962 RepID=UPI00317BF5D3